jgi:Spy/CpxP family protein refolding chaperone
MDDWAKEIPPKSSGGPWVVVTSQTAGSCSVGEDRSKRPPIAIDYQGFHTERGRTMLSFRRFVLTVAVAGLLATPAMAQQQKKGRGGFGGGMGFGGGIAMFTQEAVQKELKFTDEQKGKAQEAVTAARQAHMDELRGLQDVPQEERAAKIATVTKAMTDEAVKALALSDEQVKRYKQINIQAARAQAFALPEVQAKLNLTDDQKSQIREITTESRTKGAEIRKNAGENKEDARKQTTARNKETTEKIFALLKDDQKAAWKELTGEPFEYTPVFRRPNN